MTAIPLQSDFVEAVAADLATLSLKSSAAEKVERSADLHRKIIADRSQKKADRKRRSKARLAAFAAEIERIKGLMAEERASAATDMAAEDTLIAMSRAALAAVPA